MKISPHAVSGSVDRHSTALTSRLPGLDPGAYHFRTAADAQLQVTDPGKLTVATGQTNKVIDPQSVTQPGAGGIAPLDGKRGGGTPDHVPSLTVTYGDAA